MQFEIFLVLSGLIALSISSAPERLPPDELIIGGNSVTIDNYPYQVSIHLNLQFSKINICGGAIISKKWVITAAQCIITKRLALYKIRAGSTFRNSGGSMFTLAQIIVHSEWQLPSVDYDYAVIQIKKTFALGTTGINAVVLTSTEPAAGTAVTVTGWGTLSETAILRPKNLHAVDITIVDRTTCNSDYSLLGGLIGGITPNMICAADTGKGFCFNDNGGPLVDHATRELVGIVSYSLGCARPNFPGIYASISSVRAWITQQTGV